MIVNLLAEKHTSALYGLALKAIPMNDGPPPAAGWWNASMADSVSSWRYWNGWRWSAYLLWGGSGLVTDRHGHEHPFPPPPALLIRTAVTPHGETVPIRWRLAQPPWGDS